MRISIFHLLLSAVVASSSLAMAQWAPESMQAKTAWEQGLYGDGIKIALIGTGADVNHPSLRDGIYKNIGEMGRDEFGFDKRFNGFDDDQNGFADDWAGWNFALNDGNIVPTLKLGTQLAGVIVGQHRDVDYISGALQGIAPGAKVLPIAFVDNNGGANVDNIFKAIDYAVMREVDIINVSWTLAEDVPGLREKILSLEEQGILFVSSAGNMGKNIDASPMYPATYNFSHQLTVGAHGPSDFKIATFTNYGKNSVHLLAPGVEIMSSVPGGGMAAVSGATIATGYISATAALLMQHRPDASLLDISDAILTGTQIEDAYKDLCWTEGRVNIPYAIDEIEILLPEE